MRIIFKMARIFLFRLRFPGTYRGTDSLVLVTDKSLLLNRSLNTLYGIFQFKILAQSMAYAIGIKLNVP